MGGAPWGKKQGGSQLALLEHVPTTDDMQPLIEPGLERIARAAGGAYDRSQAVRLVAEEAYARVDCDQVFLLSPSPQPGCVSVEATAPARGAGVLADDTWRLGEHAPRIFDRCFHHSDARAEPYRSLATHLRRAHLQSWVGVPLRPAGATQPLGVMALASRNASAHLGWTEALRPLAGTAAEALGQLQREQLSCPTGDHYERMQALSNMAFGVSHSLGNIFGAILGNLYFLAEEMEGSPAAELVDRIEQSVTAGVDMMGSLGQFVEHSSDGMRHFDASELAAEILTFVGRLRSQCMAGGPELSMDLSDDCQAFGDPAQIRECLVNIIFNAIWAAGPGGSVQIATRAEDDRCRLVVSDDGPGMTSEVRRRAAEPFFTTRAGGHQGLGLSVARGIVVAHRGQLAIHTEPGHGARIEVTLPSTPPMPTDVAGQLISEALARVS